VHQEESFPTWGILAMCVDKEGKCVPRRTSYRAMTQYLLDSRALIKYYITSRASSCGPPEKGENRQEH
jgi:hypothetical protein